MANIGDQLVAPEAGWRRFDDSWAGIKHSDNATWTYSYGVDYYKNNIIYTYNSASPTNISFVFYGTKIRIISIRNVDQTINQITIDGNVETYNANGSIVQQCLLYEKTGLAEDWHEVIIEQPSGSTYLCVDAIDIDDIGFIVPDLSYVNYEDIVPEFTGFTNGAMTMTYGGAGYLTASYIPWKIFDKNVIYGWHTQNGGAVPGIWFKLDYGESISFDAYSMGCGRGSPSSSPFRMWKDWIVEISDDDINWSVAGTVTNETNWQPMEQRWYDLDTPMTGRYIKFTMNANNGNSYAEVGEVELFSVANQAPNISASLDITSIHGEDVTLTASITEPEGEQVQYKISIDGGIVIQDWTVLADEPIAINLVINNNNFSIGDNVLRLEAKDANGRLSSWTDIVTLSSVAPVISSSMIGMTLSLNITDADDDLVQFKYTLNGADYYPSNGFTSLLSQPINHAYTFPSGDVLIDQQNEVVITARDQYGAETTDTVYFTGKYSGLMFHDDAGDFYTDEFGQILKYLDFGTLIAGQTSLPLKVNLKNLNDFDVKDVIIQVDDLTVATGMTVELCKVESPFVAESILTYSGNLLIDDSISFYVRIKAAETVTLGGEFDIKANASIV